MRRLLVAYDVTGFSDEQINALEHEAVAQGEPSEPDGEYSAGHPNAPATATRLDPEGLLGRVREYRSEGTTFWKQRFEFDSGPDAWNAGMYGEGDEFAPFFSEAFLYNLLGKEDARSVLGIVRSLLEALGIPRAEQRL